MDSRVPGRRSKAKSVHLLSRPLSAGSPALHLPDPKVGHPLPPTSFRPRPPPFPPAHLPRPPAVVPGCGRPRAVAASRTMSPSRASTGGDCTTLKSRSGLGEGSTSGRHVLASLDHPATSLHTMDNSHPARPRCEMASPSHTSRRSPLKESSLAHLVTNCLVCAAKWTRPPDAGRAPGGSRGRSRGLSSALAVKKTNTLKGLLLLSRPTSQRDRKTGPEDARLFPLPRPPRLVSGTARILRNPSAHEPSLQQ